MALILDGTSGLSDVDGTAGTPAIRGSDANTGVFFGTDIVGVSTGGSERMRVDASGNVGIGTSSPGARLDVVASSTPVSVNRTDGNAALLELKNSGTVRGYIGAASDASTTFYSSAAAERARIDSSGNLLVGTTSGAFSSKGVELGNPGYIFVTRDSAIPMWVNRLNSTGVLVEYSYNSAVRGTISTNGSSVSYNTSSDYRLKHDIQPMTGALAKVQQLKPCTYKWNTDDSSGEGFIAHELQEVCPSAVTGEKDAVDAEGKPVYQGIDTSFVVPLLTAALQEAVAKIESLTARIEALENQT